MLWKDIFKLYKMKFIVDMVSSLFLKSTKGGGDDDNDIVCSNLGYSTKNFIILTLCMLSCHFQIAQEILKMVILDEVD